MKNFHNIQNKTIRFVNKSFTSAKNVRKACSHYICTGKIVMNRWYKYKIHGNRILFSNVATNRQMHKHIQIQIDNKKKNWTHKSRNVLFFSANEMRRSQYIKKLNHQLPRKQNRQNSWFPIENAFSVFFFVVVVSDYPNIYREKQTLSNRFANHCRIGNSIKQCKTVLHARIKWNETKEETRKTL